MKKLKADKKVSIRFRRWSRKGYAVFSGLHKVISIGQVSAGISNKAFIKNDASTAASPIFLVEDYNASEEDDTENDTSLFDILLNEYTLSIAVDYPVSYVHKYYLLTNGWKKLDMLFQPFLF